VPSHEREVLLCLGEILLGRPVDVAAAKGPADTQLRPAGADEIAQPALAGIAGVVVTSRTVPTARARSRSARRRGLCLGRGVRLMTVTALAPTAAVCARLFVHGPTIG
jgi:hypothetical protein